MLREDTSTALPVEDPVGALVEHNLGLAHAAASRFAGRGESSEELLQVAVIGLWRAAQRFDPARGVAFSTFATATIVGTIKHHFRDTRWGIHVPRSLQERYLAIRDTVEELGQTLGRSPTLEEIADAADLSLDAVVDGLEAGRAFRVESLDTPTATLDGGSAPTQLAGRDDPTADVERRHTVDAMLRHLSEREREIVRLRFIEDLTQREIGLRLGMSQMHVSRLLARSLERLRQLAPDVDVAGATAGAAS